MSAPSFLRVPHVPAPPHEATSLLLAAHTGWNAMALDGVEEDACDGTLTLALRPEVRRSFLEASGSLGGLVPPIGTAMTPDGRVLLVDRRTTSLRVFDPCECRFACVPCFGGRGGGPRQLRRPRGIAVAGHRLYVCDAGLDGLTVTGTDPRRNALRERVRRENHRVSVFDLDGYSLHGHLRPPPKDFPHWRPVAVAIDRRGCAWVADEANGTLHRFSGHDRWIEARGGFGRLLQVAIDACDRLHVVDETSPGVRRLQVFDAPGNTLPAPARVADVAGAFAALPFVVAADGSLDFRTSCRAWFDTNGEPLPCERWPQPPSNPWLTSGTWLSAALDSKTYRCQWHRLVLHGAIPPGCRVRVETFCADEIYDADQLDGYAVWASQDLPASARTRGPAGDCLIFSPPGRYLWLRLTLTGNGAVAPRVRAIEIEFPRITSLQYLPAVFAADAGSADFTARFLSLFDTTLRGIEREVDTLARLFDPASSPAERVGGASVDFLGWLGSWIGVSFDRSWSEARRRMFLKRAGALFDRRGTPAGLREQLLMLLGWQAPRLQCRASAPRRRCGCEPRNCAPEPATKAWPAPPLILEHFRLRRWLQLGQARLGAQAMLWGRRIVNRSELDANAEVGHTRLVMTPDPLHDPFRYYAGRYSVFVPACAGRSDTARRALENLVAGETPAHARASIVYVEPRFRIGVQSMLGFDAVIGELPAAAKLDGRPLGVATLVGGSTRQVIRTGVRGRLGTGARLG